jgi:hypothetical protein
MSDRQDENPYPTGRGGAPDPEQLLTALSTEQFTLPGARSQTMSESSAAEDFRYGLAINRIRHYYKEVAGDRASLFLLSGHDDGEGVFANMGLPAEGRKPYFAFSSAILAVNSVVGGAAVAIAAGAFLDASLGVAVGVGIVATIVSVVAWIRYADRLLDASAAQTEPLFPLPSRSGADRPAN